MRPSASLRAQRGTTLVVALIMLGLITLLVTSAFTLSTGNIKAVGNMQMRNEALAAANKAIEQVLDTPFTTAPSATTVDADINNDGTTDYAVVIDAPTCVSATLVPPAVAPPGFGTSVLVSLGSGAGNFYQSVWELVANVTDPASGATVRVRQGVNVLLTQAQYDATCDI
jgi:type II secretory pathway pseudopilin PulG